MTRKLATIQRVVALLPIEGADRIELCQVLGWQCVVKKDEFKVGELVCWFEIDSWLPTEIAPFLTKEGKEPKVYNGIAGERLKTIKLRKQLSQGLVLPLSLLGEKQYFVLEGDDVSAQLGITKWERAEENVTSNNGTATGSRTRPFPYFIRKTDQVRIQNIGSMVAGCLDEEFEATMKKDGSSMTVFRVDPTSRYYNDAKKLVRGKMGLFNKIKAVIVDFFVKEPVYGICSRNLLLNIEGDSNFHKAAAKHKLYTKLEEACAGGGSFALQGELIAPNIQDNHEKVDSVEWQCFDIFDIDLQRYVLPTPRRSVCKVHNIPHVTLLAIGRLCDIVESGSGKDATHIVKKMS